MCNDIRDLTNDEEIINKVEKFEDFVRYNYDVEIISKNSSEVKSHKFSAKTVEISDNNFSSTLLSVCFLYREILSN